MCSRESVLCTLQEVYSVYMCLHKTPAISLMWDSPLKHCQYVLTRSTLNPRDPSHCAPVTQKLCAPKTCAPCSLTVGTPQLFCQRRPSLYHRGLGYCDSVLRREQWQR